MDSIRPGFSPCRACGNPRRYNHRLCDACALRMAHESPVTLDPAPVPQTDWNEVVTAVSCIAVACLITAAIYFVGQSLHPSGEVAETESTPNAMIASP